MSTGTVTSTSTLMDLYHSAGKDLQEQALGVSTGVEVLTGQVLAQAWNKTNWVRHMGRVSGSASKPVHSSNCDKGKANLGTRHYTELEPDQVFALFSFGFHHYARCCAHTADEPGHNLALLAGAPSMLAVPLRALRTATTRVDVSGLSESEALAALSSKYLFLYSEQTRTSPTVVISQLNVVREALAKVASNVGFEFMDSNASELFEHLDRVVTFLLSAHATRRTDVDVQAHARAAVTALLGAKGNPFEDGSRDLPWSGIRPDFGRYSFGKEPSSVAWAQFLENYRTTGNLQESVDQFITFENGVLALVPDARVRDLNFTLTSDMIGRSLEEVTAEVFRSQSEPVLEQMRKDLTDTVELLCEQAELAGSLKMRLHSDTDLNALPEGMDVFVCTDDAGAGYTTIEVPTVVAAFAVASLRKRASYRATPVRVEVISSPTHSLTAQKAIESALNDPEADALQVAANLTLVEG